MAVLVVLPWRAGCPHREAAHRWVRARYAAHHPGWRVVDGVHDEGPWSKATAVAAGLAQAEPTDTLIVADADVWVDDLDSAVEAVAGGAPWAIPHRNVHRLTHEATAAVLAGANPAGQPLEQPPYRGYLGGGITVLPVATYLDVPLDPRFRGWGREDESWAAALMTLVGPPRRFPAPLWHLWHPPQDRPTRRSGAPATEALHARYRAAKRRPDRMAALVAEAKEVTPWPPASSSTAAASPPCCANRVSSST